VRECYRDDHESQWKSLKFVVVVVVVAAVAATLVVAEKLVLLVLIHSYCCYKYELHPYKPNYNAVNWATVFH